MFWLATRQKSLIGQLFGVAMQLLAASAFINGFALVGETRAHALPVCQCGFRWTRDAGIGRPADLVVVAWLAARVG